MPYKVPPDKSKFKPGVSGNPAGRPPKGNIKNLKDALTFLFGSDQGVIVLFKGGESNNVGAMRETMKDLDERIKFYEKKKQ